ncbi:MAG: hypothetical protein QOH70_3540 [Blastocatellia bacterium]|jgi:hypothetical protein|nr:hypothetical protein [Blastocatellia bacterium]
MGFETFLIPNINHMDTLLALAESAPREEGTHITEAAVVGCRSLQRLIAEPGFIRTVVDLAAARLDRSGSDTDEFKSLVRSYENFESFLRIEQEIMTKAGFFPDVAKQIMQLGQLMRESILARAQPASEIIDQVRLLRDQACNLSQALIKEGQKKQDWAITKQRVRKILIGTGGAALVGLNAVAALITGAPTAGLTVAGAAVSGAIGGSIISSATSPVEKSQSRSADA